LVGPLEAASIEGDDTDASEVADTELVDPNELPTWREDG
jgi:hypothetical protein